MTPRLTPIYESVQSKDGQSQDQGDAEAKARAYSKPGSLFFLVYLVSELVHHLEAHHTHPTKTTQNKEVGDEALQ